MNVLPGYKTYITAGVMIVVAVAEMSGVSIPGFSGSPGELLTGAIGLVFARLGASNTKAVS